MDRKRIPIATAANVGKTMLATVAIFCLASSSMVQARDERQEQMVSPQMAASQAASMAASGAGSAAMSSMPGSSGGADAGGQSQFQQMLSFGLNPVSSSMKYLIPNAYAGAQADLSNGYYSLSNGLSNGFNGFTSSVMDRYQALENNVLNRMTRQMQMQEELMNRMYQLVQNPEQVCKAVADRAKAGLEQTNKQAQQAAETASSYVRKYQGLFGR